LLTKKPKKTMPNIKVVFWNIENFGSNNNFYGNSMPRCSLIANAIFNSDADVILIQEFILGHQAPLVFIQEALNNQAGQDWYCDWIPGALQDNAASPYSTRNDVGFTPKARDEGYIVFWRQNIAKFIMQIADPIEPISIGLPAAPMIPNTQSNGVIARQVGPAAVVTPTLNILAGNITVPAGAGTYILPVNTNVGAGGIVNNGNVIPAGNTAAAHPLNAGDILPVGTIIGPGGMTLAAQTQGTNPIIIPQQYTLTAPFTLPPNGTVVVPQHTLSLVLTGRPYSSANGGYLNFNPGGMNWGLLSFPDGIGTFYLTNPRWTRRPATCTIRVNAGGVAAAELIPITVYHTPASPSAASNGMGTAAMSRTMYQAFNHPTATYVNCNRAIIGGDFNVRLDSANPAFRIFTDPIGVAGGYNGGAGCNDVAYGQNIRVNTPFPAGGLPLPQFPPPPAIITQVPSSNPVNKTLVKLRQRIGNINGNPILSNNIDHYRTSAIDNIFYKGFNAAQSPHHAFGDVYPLPNAVSGVGNPGATPFYIVQGVIQLFQGLPIFNPIVAANMPSVLAPNTILADIQAGGFGNTSVNGIVSAATGVAAPPAPAVAYDGPVPIPANVTVQRRTNEFIRSFVSDHLPVIFEMNI
jgi:hypothetical protein